MGNAGGHGRGTKVALKSSMTNFMKTFKGETYWAASDIGWATRIKLGRTLACVLICADDLHNGTASYKILQ